MSQMPMMTLTEHAAARIATLIADEEGALGLRLSVTGGGCSGFSYEFDIATEQTTTDCAICAHGAVLLIDEMSLPFVAGAELDYVEDLMGSKFDVRNPNATASCGCGVSFSV